MPPSHVSGSGAALHRLCGRGRAVPPAGEGSGPEPGRANAPLGKLVVVGGPATGKSTLIRTVSDVGTVAVEAAVSASPARGTTVAMDFGRITVDDEYVYLFGTPGQSRFRFMWDRLAHGAGGAVLLADSRRIADSAPARAFLTGRGLPFVVLVNRFDDTPVPAPRRLRGALGVPPAVRVLSCDARVRTAALRALTASLAHLRSAARTSTASVRPHPRDFRCGHPLTPPTSREHP